MKHHKIIGISEIMPFFEAMLHKLVEFIEINIGKELRCQIADRKASRLIFVRREFRAEASYHVSKQRSRVLVIDFLEKNFKQNAMIDTCEEFPHIAFEHPKWPLKIVAFAACVRDELFHSLVSALTNTARIRVVNESRLEHGSQVLHDGVMEHAITHSCFVNVAQLGILDEKRCIRPVPICFFRERLLKIPEIIFKVTLEFHDIGLVRFANLEFSP